MYIVELKSDTGIVFLDFDKVLWAHYTPADYSKGQPYPRFVVGISIQEKEHCYVFTKGKLKPAMEFVREYAAKTRDTVRYLEPIDIPAVIDSPKRVEPLMDMDQVQAAIRQGTLCFNGGVVYFANDPHLVLPTGSLPIGTIACSPDGSRSKLSSLGNGYICWTETQ